MTDVFSKEKRSFIMSRVSGKDTGPEMVVRRMLHMMGFRYRLHAKDLPGKPDVVLPRHRKVVFVHGCFWHGHRNCKRSKRPSSNEKFWNEKIEKNIKRDETAKRKLKKVGWDVLVVWECQTKNKENLKEILLKLLNGGRENE